MEPQGSLPHSQVPPPVPILSQIDPVHVLTSHFLKILLNIIVPSAHGSSKLSFFLSSFPTKTLYTSLLSPIRAMPSPIHSSRLDYPNNILGEEYRSLSSSFCLSEILWSKPFYKFWNFTWHVLIYRIFLKKHKTHPSLTMKIFELSD